MQVSRLRIAARWPLVWIGNSQTKRTLASLMFSCGYVSPLPKYMRRGFIGNGETPHEPEEPRAFCRRRELATLEVMNRGVGGNPVIAMGRRNRIPKISKVRFHRPFPFQKRKREKKSRERGSMEGCEYMYLHSRDAHDAGNAVSWCLRNGAVPREADSNLDAAHRVVRRRPGHRGFMPHPAALGSSDPAALCRETQKIVAHAFQIAVSDLRQPTRCRADIALARQAAMYLANIAGGVSLSDVARGFGRDRSTVAHACGRIEDWRDDPRVDRSLALLESALRSTFRMPDLH
jgi:hypothetical protein